ncbi:Mg-chelatase subunit ChlD [Pseudonocardia sediminis]|uniref:Mg-chelatase subunit ChlD n=1 Tax=Pseudonocardia sediminis TaxID=1397368 RepID=A0A4Q7UXS9_PSEST|nr:vWA domain-containing protein [Pseudonocardia sediminis]RZT86842.1 Mg-chelatase subunit ChlD [Pseudonocardia sediminis]
MLDAEAFDAALKESPDTTLALMADMARATDEKLRAAARRLAGRIMLDTARSGPPRERGIGRLRPVPADRGGDLDLDASLGTVAEARAAGRVPALDELTARAWARPGLAVCLLVDASGSMGGTRLAAAALAAAACAWRAPGEHAVLSFAKEVTVLRSLHSTRAPAAVVDDVLGLRGHGVTGLAGALRAAGEQLSRTRAARKVVVLLSDCRATDDQDPLPAAARLPELLVLAPAEDTEQAEDLTRRTGGRWAPIAGAADAASALTELLAR